MRQQRSERRPVRLAKAAIPAGLAVAATLALAAPAAAIVDGTDDVDTRQGNAVVHVKEQGWGRCTGVLITSEIVATAGHCISQEARGSDNPPHAPAQVLDDCQGDWQVSGRWYPVQRTVTIRVGQDLASTTDFLAEQYTLPVCGDLMLFRLERPVSASDAVPVPVLANFGDGDGMADVAKLAGESFKVAGWGLDTETDLPSRRQEATARYDSYDYAKLRVNLDAPAQILGESGDSGSPLLWTSPSGVRYVVGIMQKANGPSASYTPTFRGPLDNGAPGVSAFFNRAAPEALECPRSAWTYAKVTLGSWWSAGRKDNMLITTPSFAGCHSAVRSPGYAYHRTEGYLFDPQAPA